ncbi:hypothetical protein M569_12659, partial [Genlisea aurea]
SLWRQLSGERAVVLLYLIRILCSTPFFLFPEAFSLCSLSIFALSVEIAADEASNPLSSAFRTRPGASSGIFLSAVTLPGLLVSKLIQTLRAESLLDEAAFEGLHYLRLQYWAASASCLTVLIYLVFISKRHEDGINNTKHTSFCWILVYSLICIVLLGCWPLVVLLSWLLGHGLASIKLMKKILHTFPACASIGESLLVTTGLVIFFGDMVAYTAAKVGVIFKFFFLQLYFKRSEISTIIQGMVASILIFPLLYKYLVEISERSVRIQVNEEDVSRREMRKSVVFYVSLAAVLIFVAPSWMQYVHPFQSNPLLWVLHFVLSDQTKRLLLCMYWLVVIYVSVTRFYGISKNSKTERILLRKYYHLMAVAMFVPALVFQ